MDQLKKVNPHSRQSKARASRICENDVEELVTKKDVQELATRKEEVSGASPVESGVRGSSSKADVPSPKADQALDLRKALLKEKSNKIKERIAKKVGKSDQADQSDDGVQEETSKALPKDEQEVPSEEIKEFFSDNAERYKAKDDYNTAEIVPVLPIIVPDRIKHRFNPAYIQTESTSNKHYRDPESETFQTSKRTRNTRYQFTRKEDIPMKHFGSDTIIDADTYEAALRYDEELELRAKQAMLKDNRDLAAADWTDPMLVAEYEEEIFEHLRESERETLPESNYVLNQQHEVTWKMRGVLIDWIIELHYIFQLLPETLYLAVNIIDRFLSKRTVALGKLQLVGVAALFIATKFEEVVSPRLRDLLITADKSLKEEDLLKAERFILQTIDFKLCYPNPLNFLRRASKTEDYDMHSRMLAKYFLEISVVDHHFIGIPPSKVAAAALWLSQRMLDKGDWTEEISELAGYKAHELRPIVQMMLDFLAKPITHDAFFRKWASKRLMKASIFARSWLQQYYNK